MASLLMSFSRGCAALLELMRSESGPESPCSSDGYHSETEPEVERQYDKNYYIIYHHHFYIKMFLNIVFYLLYIPINFLYLKKYIEVIKQVIRMLYYVFFCFLQEGCNWSICIFIYAESSSCT